MFFFTTDSLGRKPRIIDPRQWSNREGTKSHNEPWRLGADALKYLYKFNFSFEFLLNFSYFSENQKVLTLTLKKNEIHNLSF